MLFVSVVTKLELMDDNFSPRVKDVITFSKEEALRLGHNFIGTEHLMLGILRDGEGKAISILNAIDIDLEELRRKVEILNPAVLENGNALNNKKTYTSLDRRKERLKRLFLRRSYFKVILSIRLTCFCVFFVMKMIPPPNYSPI